MVKLFPSFLVALLLMGRLASGQTFTNGSFETGDFTGWQVAGVPTVIGSTPPPITLPPPPVDGTYQALINSTGTSGSGIYANADSVSAANLETFLGTTLPSNMSSGGQTQPPINGEAIQQTFSTLTASTITFSYAYQSREAPGNGFDETGYVLNGVFHVLADTNTPGQTPVDGGGDEFTHGLPYQRISIPVPAGTNTIGFVTYNTQNTSAPSGLYVDDVIVTPIIPVAYSAVNPTGSSSAQATGVSGNNIVGWFNDSSSVQHGFFYDGTNYTTLDPTGSTDTQATAVDGTNVVGWYIDSSSVQHGFIYNGSNYTVLDPTGSADTQATGVSGTNVVGWYKDSGGVQHGFFFDGTNYTVVDPAGSTDTVVTGVSGTNVVGWYIDGSSVQHGFFFDGTNYTVIDPTGSTDTQATAISGTAIVGWYVDGSSVQHGFLYNGSTYTTLDPFGSTDTQATSISGNGVVGWYIDGNSVQHGFYYDGATFNTLDPSGTTDTQATGISGGNFVGWYADSGNVHHAFLSFLKTQASVTLSNLNQTYDGTPKSATANTTPTGLNVTFTYKDSSNNVTSTPPTAAGTYTVVATINDPIYYGLASGTLTIGQGTANVSLINLNQTYDGTPKSAGATTTPTGLNVTFTYEDSGNNISSTPPTNAGTYTVTGTINDPNYTGQDTETFTIAKATAAVSLTGLNQTYDGTPKSVLESTTPTGLTVTVTYTDSNSNVSATPPTNAGTYTATGTVNDPNYAGQDSETFTIAQASASVTLGSLTATYDGNSHAATVSTTPNGLSVAITYEDAANNVSSVPPVNAGVYTVTGTIADPNYSGQDIETLTIAKASASVMLGNLTATYDGTPHPATATTTPTGLGVAFSYKDSGNNVSATPPTAAGTYTVTGVITDPNYQGMSSGPLVIAQATATIAFSNLNPTYDGTPKSATATTTPLGLTVTLTYTDSSSNVTSTPPTNAGTYTVTGTISDANYQGTNTGSLVIGKATANVVLSNLNQTYDGTPKSATATTTPTGLTVTFTYEDSGNNISSTPPTNAGTYAVTGTINDPNYQGSNGGSFVIAKASASVALGDLNQTYDGTPKSATATTTPTGLTVTFRYAPQGSSNFNSTPPTTVGSYTVTGTIDDINYQGNTSGTLTIAQANATVVLGSLTATYDGNPHAATATTTPTGLTVTFSYKDSSNNISSTPPTGAGSYTVTGTINDTNYSGQDVETLTIAKASATVVLGSLTATYDGNSHGATATTTPTGLTVTYSYEDSSNTISSTPPTAAGTYTVTGTITDANYSGQDIESLTIAKATASVMLANLSQTYDGTPKAATATTTPTGLTVTFTYKDSGNNVSANPPSAIGTYLVTATINDTNYSGSITGTLTISMSGQTFSQWETSYSIAGAPTDTPENDGVPNLLKYLYDINPTRPMTSADIAALPTFGSATVASTDYLTLTYRQYSLETGLTIHVQTSSDLQNWTTVNPADISQQVGTDPVTGDPIMQVGVVATGARQFIRLDVTMP